MSNYDTDILLWSERQSALLRRMGAGERVNDQLDWENLAEEIESVGREQVHAVESLLTQALLHLLEAEAWPQSREVVGWEAEALLFIARARRRFVPSMRRRLTLPVFIPTRAAHSRKPLTGWRPSRWQRLVR